MVVAVNNPKPLASPLVNVTMTGVLTHLMTTQRGIGLEGKIGIGCLREDYVFPIMLYQTWKTRNSVWKLHFEMTKMPRVILFIFSFLFIY